MSEFLALLNGGALSDNVVLGLLAASFAGSFITVVLGIGGGALLLAIMASFLPAAALIPVHGVVQFGSNSTRAALLRDGIQWPAVLIFTAGAVVGAVVGGMIVVDLPPGLIQIGIGLFIIWGVFRKPPAWLSRAPALSGAISSCLTMFFGATGPFVASYVKSLALPRTDHVATHSALMTIQHALKIIVFGILGFAFGPWLPFIAAMILCGLAGTLIGRSILVRMSDRVFKRALDLLLIAISIRLIWSGAATFL